MKQSDSYADLGLDSSIRNFYYYQLSRMLSVSKEDKKKGKAGKPKDFVAAWTILKEFELENIFYNFFLLLLLLKSNENQLRIFIRVNFFHLYIAKISLKLRRKKRPTKTTSKCTKYFNKHTIK